MSKSEKFFSVAIRLVFVAAFAAFLLASLRHIATFFQNYEPANSDSDWGSYALAWSIDGTALMLTVGMMFFGKRMSWVNKTLVWFFVIALTAFSWLVNWEYAAAYQQTGLIGHLPAAYGDINPILASSFAFLNMAYTIIAEIFSSREPTVDELKAELDALTGEAASLKKQIEAAKGPGLIDRAKSAAIKAKEAAQEIASAGRENLAPATPETEVETGPISAPDLAQNPANFSLKTAGTFAPETSPTFAQKTPPVTPRFFDEEPGGNFVYNQPTFREKSNQDLTQNSAPDQPEIFAETEATTDPEMLATARQDSGELYGVELPVDPEENAQFTTEFEAVLGLRGDKTFTPYTPGQDLTANSQNSAPAAHPAPVKQTTGLTYREASKLKICQDRGVKAGDIRAAVNAKKLSTYRDGSVSKTAVENWAKSLVASK